MGIPLKTDHQESGLYFSSVNWDSTRTLVDMRYYKNRAVSGGWPELYGVFRFSTWDRTGLQSEQGELLSYPWDGDPAQHRNMGSCTTDIYELTDIPDRSGDARLMTVQDAPWTWALPNHKIRLTLEGYWSVEFDVYFPQAVGPIDWSGTWTLFQDYR